MHRNTRLIIQFYSHLLRLYPSRFRAEYADEMRTVFAHAVHENENTLSLLALLAAELRDLPVRVLQEHLQARRKRLLVSNSGVIMMESTFSAQVFRYLSISLLLVMALFAFMVVLPFFSLGLQTQTHMEVISGSLGPEAFPLYSGKPNALPGVAVLVMLAAPAWNAIFGIATLSMLAWFWKRLSSNYRWLGVIAVAAAITPLLFLFLPVGRIVFSWWMN